MEYRSFVRSSGWPCNAPLAGSIGLYRRRTSSARLERGVYSVKTTSSRRPTGAVCAPADDMSDATVVAPIRSAHRRHSRARLEFGRLAEIEECSVVPERPASPRVYLAIDQAMGLGIYRVGRAVGDLV